MNAMAATMDNLMPVCVDTLEYTVITAALRPPGLPAARALLGSLSCLL